MQRGDLLCNLTTMRWETGFKAARDCIKIQDHTYCMAGICMTGTPAERGTPLRAPWRRVFSMNQEAPCVSEHGATPALRARKPFVF